MNAKKKSTLNLANEKKAKGLTRDAILLPVLAAWAHEEISIGCARDLLRMPDDKIREEAEKRVSNAVKEREYRELLESRIQDLGLMVRRLSRRLWKDHAMADMNGLCAQAENLLTRCGVDRSPLREPGDDVPRCSECGYTEEDARSMMDHRLCSNYGRAPWSKAVGEVL